MIILILLWVVLTIFSIIGFLFFSDSLWDIFGQSDTVDTIAVLVNFYFFNFLAWILLRKSSLVVLNKILIYIVTGILIGAVELYVIYLILDGVFDLSEGATFYLMLILGIIIIPLGGTLYFFRLVLNDLSEFISAFFEGLKRNTLNSAIRKSKERKNKPTPILKKMIEIDKFSKELDDILKKYK